MVLSYAAAKSKSCCHSPSSVSITKYPRLSASQRKELHVLQFWELNAQDQAALGRVSWQLRSEWGAHVEEHTLRDKKPE